MPTPEPVAREEVALAEAREDVLEVGRRRCERADRLGARRTVAHCDRKHARDSARDLETPGRDVVVRDGVAGRMQDRPEEGRCEPRTREGTGRSTCCHVERDDQERRGASSSRGAGWPFSTRSRSMSSEAAPRDSGNSSPIRSQSAAASAYTCRTVGLPAFRTVTIKAADGAVRVPILLQESRVVASAPKISLKAKGDISIGQDLISHRPGQSR